MSEDRAIPVFQKSGVCGLCGKEKNNFGGCTCDTFGNKDGGVTREEERILCKKDMCLYCRGEATDWDVVPVGPNSIGNWTHVKINDVNKKVLCLASPIFLREWLEHCERTRKFEQHIAEFNDKTHQYKKLEKRDNGFTHPNLKDGPI